MKARWLRDLWPAFVLPLVMLAAVALPLVVASAPPSCSSYGAHVMRIDGHCARLLPWR
jgi:hypothetical protein